MPAKIILFSIRNSKCRHSISFCQFCKYKIFRNFGVDEV